MFLVIVEGRRADQDYIVYYWYYKMFSGKGEMVDESIFNVNSVREAVKPGCKVKSRDLSKKTPSCKQQIFRVHK